MATIDMGTSYRPIRFRPKIKRMCGPIKSGMCDCYFCKKKIKWLHKYVEMSPDLEYISGTHLECYAKAVMGAEYTIPDYWVRSE